MTMKKVMILVSLMVFVTSLSMPVKKANAFDMGLGTGIGIVIMFFGGSIIQYHNYPECRKEETLGDMAKCIEKVKEEREAKELKKDENT